jgi:hypothetical protein
MTACAFERTDPDLCEFGLDAHHIVPKATIKGQYTYWHSLMPQMRQERGLPDTLPLLEEALLDRRNLVPLCRRHHELVTGHRIYVTADMWPEGIWEFADTIGCRWYLDKWAEAA